MKEEKKEEQFGDIVYNHDLKKHTIMVAGFPALVISYVAGGQTLYKGFLPGFEFAQVEGLEDEEICVDYLQDMKWKNLSSLESHFQMWQKMTN